MESPAAEPIAIIGMGCRFPGASSSSAFWELMRDGVDAISEVPRERFDIDTYFDPEPGVPGKTNSRWGGFIPDVDRFDAGFFGIAPREVEVLDPQQRLLLEIAWEALEDAGLPLDRIAGGKVGVYVGISHNDYSDLQCMQGLEPTAYFGTGRSHSLAANRLSYTFDLHGPSVAIDTACSSSLVAAHLACQSLRRNECELALVGGINLILSPLPTIGFSQAHMLSSDGRCKSFDASANGYVRSDGCGVIVLKPLSAALRDGDPVAALIRGSATNEDGRTNGVMVPNARAQEAVIRDALRDAGLHPCDLSYVEAHGTGTPVGDPIEIDALKAVLTDGRSPDKPCIIGTAKANIGHTEPAAGIAGIIRTALILRHRQAPPHLHLKQLNPEIHLEGTPLRITREISSLEGDGKALRAGINSFGFGGTNCHVILEEAPPNQSDGVQAPTHPQLLVLSAKTPEALAATVDAYHSFLASPADAATLHDVCFTAAVRRTHHAERLALVGSTADEIRELLEAARQGEERKGLSRGTANIAGGKTAFVFSGMGSQWAGMGRDLAAREPVFRYSLERCDTALRQYVDWSVLDEIHAGEEDSRLADIGVLQPLLFAIGVALADLWRSWGVEPDAVVGHSVGEIAAAHAAGALSLDEAAKVVWARATSLRLVGGEGAMLSVGLPVHATSRFLEGHEETVSVGAVNSPASTVLSGDPRALNEIAAQLDRAGIFSRFVPSDIAFHSSHMDPVLEPFARAMGEIHPAEATIPIYSTVTGGRCSGCVHDSAYWLRNLRQPVALAPAVERMLDDGYDTFIEISPHAVLAHALQETAEHAGKDVLVTPSQRRREDGQRTMLQSLGALHVQGYPLKWDALHGSGARCVPLPSYPWQRERFWIDDRAGNHPRRATRLSSGLLGELVVSAAHADKLVWETTVGFSSFPYLADHVVASTTLFPASAFAEMALAVASTLGSGPHVIEDLRFIRGLVLSADTTTTLQVVASTDTPGMTSLQFLSRDANHRAGHDQWVLHATGSIRSGTVSAGGAPVAERGPDEIEASLDQSIAAAEHYRHMKMRSLNFGPAFQSVEHVQWGDMESLARIHLPAAAGSASGYTLHPAALDGCFQAFSALTPLTPYLPASIEQLRVYDVPHHGLWVHSRRRTANKYADVLEGDIRVFNADGQLVAEVRGFRVQSRTSEAAGNVDEWLYETRWEQGADLPCGQAVPEALQGRWLILAGQGELGPDLASLLEARGLPCALAFPGPTYKRVDSGQYLVDPSRGEDVRRMLHDLVAEGRPLRGIVHLWTEEWGNEAELSAESLREAQERGTVSAMHLAQSLLEIGQKASPRLWLVTRGAQPVDGIDEMGLAQSPLLGFGRVLAEELPEYHCSRIDLDPLDRSHDAQQLLDEMLSGGHEDEVAVRAGTRYVYRFVRYRPTSTIAETREAMLVGRDVPFTLATSKPGILDDLGFHLAPRPTPGPGELEVHVEVTGLNFRDVMSAMGILPGYPDGLGPLGYECAGHVTAVGPGVHSFQIGDAVVALGQHTFGSYVRVDARLTALKPSQLTFEEAVTIPVTFLTAHYALHHLARLEAGERVLIHAAAGGVGLAAVQLAQAVGAEIFATAGSPEKREYLRSLGVAHVMDSRSLDFADEIMRSTSGDGVQVVLNSLAGEFIPKSLSVLGPYGRFLEIGRRDIYGNSQLGLSPFQRNLSFFAIDLDRLHRERTDFLGDMLRTLIGKFEAGSLRPLPHATYQAADVVDGFRHTAQAKHIGKVVISFTNGVPIRIPEGVRFRPDASYLITGGLGGLGLTVAHWMVQQGARSLVLVGRRGATPEVETDVARLEEAGCMVTCAAVNVAQEREVAELLDEIDRTLPPLRGVIHAAGVLDDTTLGGLDRERLERVMAPKIAGAWNLHRLSRDTPLDFFVLFSSLATVFGNGGQGNYAAANQFLDALAHFRRRRGLPGLSIAWGPWSDVGMVSSVQLLDRLTAQGLAGISPRHGLIALDRLIPEQTAHVAVVSIDWPRRFESKPSLANSPFLSHLAHEWSSVATATAPSAGRREALAATPPEDRNDAVASYLREQVAKVMGISTRTVAVERPLTSLGLDSLMAVELRTRIHLDLDVDIPAKAFLDGIAIEQITTIVLLHFSMQEALGANGSRDQELEEIIL